MQSRKAVKLFSFFIDFSETGNIFQIKSGFPFFMKTGSADLNK